MQDETPTPDLDNIDLSKITAIHQKRTLAFVNHFVTTTVHFLNSFMRKCEERLMQFERKLEKVDASLILLEARLSSIPEVNILQTEEIKQTAVVTVEIADNPNESTEVASLPPTEKEPQSYPEYDRFIKMVQVGVPLDAVKLKLSLEGLDSTLFDKILKKW